MTDLARQEQAYRAALEDLRLSHNQWRGMMRLALWASVLGMLFARLNASRLAFIIAAIGFIVGIFCFSKVWLTRQKMKRLVSSRPIPPEAPNVDSTSENED